MLCGLCAAMALVPSHLSLGTEVRYGHGRFTDAGGYHTFRFESSNGFYGAHDKIDLTLFVGNRLQFGMGLSLENATADKFPSKDYCWIYDGWVVDIETVSEERHQYTYGGNVFIEYNAIVSPYAKYGFKKVATYRYFDYRTYYSDTTWSLSTIKEFSLRPAYDLSIGLKGRLPKTPMFIYVEHTLKERIWEIDRSSWTVGCGFSINIGALKFRRTIRRDDDE